MNHTGVIEVALVDLVRATRHMRVNGILHIYCALFFLSQIVVGFLVGASRVLFTVEHLVYWASLRFLRAPPYRRAFSDDISHPS